MVMARDRPIKLGVGALLFLHFAPLSCEYPRSLTPLHDESTRILQF